MFDLKVWKLLKVLKPGEVKKLPLWLQLNSKGGDEKLLQLTEILVEAFPQMPEKDHVLHKLFPGLDEKEALHKLSTPASRLVNMLKSYLAVIHLQQKQAEQEVLTLEALTHREALEAFGLMYKKAERNLKQKGIANTSLAKMAYQLCYLKQMQKLSISTDKHQAHLPNMKEAHSIWWCHELLEHILIRLASPGQEAKALSMEEKVAIARAKALTEGRYLPLLAFYIGMIQLLLEENNLLHTRIEELKALKSKISQVELRNCFSALLNFCIRQYRSSPGQDYLDELLDLYSWGFETQAAFQGKYLAPQQLKNALSLSMEDDRYTAAQDLMDQYLRYIAPGVRKDMQAIGQAMILFDQEAYRKVFHLLAPVRFMDLNQEVHGRLLLAQSRYKLVDTDLNLLLSQIDAALKFIKRNDLGQKHEGYVNAFLALKKLITQYGKREKLKKLRATLEQTKRLNNRPWLIRELTLASR